MTLTWDVETHRMKHGMMAPRLVCVSAFDGAKKYLFDRRDGMRFMTEQLRKGRPLVAHNGCYDVGILAAEDPDLLPEIFAAYDRGQMRCTKIREMIIQNARGELKFEYDPIEKEYKKQDFTLARLVLRRLQKNIYAKKGGPGARWRLNYHELDGVPVDQYPKEAADYAIEDSIYTHALYQHQEADIEPYDRAPGEIDRTKVSWALHLASTWGVRTDADAVRAYKEELQIEYAKHIEICQRYGFRRKNKSRDTKLIQAAVEQWYRENKAPMQLTEGGAVSTCRDQLMDTDHEGLHAVANSIRYEKLLSTYITALERGTVVPLCPSYNPMVETWRTSCSGGQKIDGVPMGFNSQNAPRNGLIRECVVAREGSVFAFCDLDTVELRVLAEVCLELFGHSDLATAIKEGRDLHVDLAASIFGLNYRQAFARYQDGDLEIENARQYSKIGNYGLGGGMGPDAFIAYAKGYGIRVTRKEAKKLHEGFRRKWSEMSQYFRYVSALVKGGPVELYEFPLTGLYRGNVGYTQLCNGNFQHPTAIFATAALYQATKECYVDRGSPLHGCRPWLFNHDEIGIEIPYDDIGPERASAAALRLREIMIREAEKICRRVPIGASVAMCPKWYKGAKDIYEGGLLVPVQPEKQADGKKTWVPWEGRFRAQPRRAAA